MSSERKTRVLVLSIYRDLAEAFIESAATGNLADKVVFDVVAGDPHQNPGWEEMVANADAMAFVVRFLDVLSLDKIKSVFRALPSEIDVPLGMFMLRDENEIDFKISCPACGQKLWLRDTDVGKRGRCPNCKKPFVILSQQDHIRSQLLLPDAVPITKIVRNDTAVCKQALETLVEAASAGIVPADTSVSSEALKNATMRIQIPPDGQ